MKVSSYAINYHNVPRDKKSKIDNGDHHNAILISILPTEIDKGILIFSLSAQPVLGMCQHQHQLSTPNPLGVDSLHYLHLPKTI